MTPCDARSGSRGTGPRRTLAACAWVTLVTYCWPQSHPPAIAPTPPTREPDPAGARRAARAYAVLFAAAAGIGLALGYRLDLVHVAWAAAAMFIMRPGPGLLASCAVGRTVATFAGVVAAGLLAHRGPTEIALAVVTVAAIAAMVAVRTSRWYVTGAGSGLIVLLISGVAGTHAFGAGLALTFGVAIPAGLRWLARPEVDPAMRPGHPADPPRRPV